MINQLKQTMKKKIKKSGFQKQFLAKKIGVSKKTFSDRLRLNNWKDSELVILNSIL